MNRQYLKHKTFIYYNNHMNEWFKNICLTPLKFGLDKINSLAINSIALILESCANKIFKIDPNEKIINKIETHNNKNIFIFHPLQLKEFPINIDHNVIKIESGLINNMTISVPWKTILMETSNINIDNIDIIISISELKNNNSMSDISVLSTFLESSSSNNSNLQDAHSEIKSLLTKYFGNINLNIEKINIVINKNLKIVASGIEYHNNLVKVTNILIYSNTNNNPHLYTDFRGTVDCTELLAKFDNISYNISLESIVVDVISIKSSIVDFLFLIYVDFYGKSKFNFNISCNNLKIDKLVINNLTLMIDQDKLLIEKLSSMYIDNVFILRPKINDNILLSFNYNDFECFFMQLIYLYIIDYNSLLLWLTKIKHIIANTCNKIIYVNSRFETSKQNSHTFKQSLWEHSQNNSSFQLHTLQTSIIYKDNIVIIQINNISFDKTITMHKLVFEHNDTILNVNNLEINNDGLMHFMENELISKDFKITSVKTSVLYSKKQIKINLHNAEINNFIEIINYVTQICDSCLLLEKNNITDLNSSTIDFSSSLDNLSDDNNMKIILNISKSKLTTQFNNVNLLVLVKKIEICVNDYFANDIDLDFFIDNFLLAKICAQYCSKTKFIIDSVKINLTIEIIDKLNNLMSALLSTLENNNEKKKIVDVNTSVEKNVNYVVIDQYEPIKTIIEHSHVKQSVNNSFRPKVVNNLKLHIINTTEPNIINDYGDRGEQFDLKIKIELLEINLYDLFEPSNKNNRPFVRGIAKKITFTKIIDQIKKNSLPNIRIIQHPLLNRPDIINNYQLEIDTGAIIDTFCVDPEWKYFIKFSQYNMLKMHIAKCGNIVNASIYLSLVTTNIREETLIRLYKFVTNIPKNMNNTDNQLLIEKFNINSIDLIFNYFPSILENMQTGSKIFTIKNHKIILSSLTLSYISSINKLFEIVSEKWSKDADFDNIIKFVPNIKIIEPYTKYIIDFIRSTIKFFKNIGDK